MYSKNKRVFRQLRVTFTGKDSYIDKNREKREKRKETLKLILPIFIVYLLYKTLKWNVVLILVFVIVV